MKRIFFVLCFIFILSACNNEVPIQENDGLVNADDSITAPVSADKVVTEVTPPPNEVAPPVQEVTPKVSDSKVSPPLKVAIPSDSVPANVQSPIIQGKARDVLSKADLKVKTFSYVYREPPYNQGSDRYVIMGDKIRIQLGEDNLNLVTGVSDIFLNTKTKQAAGYCFKRDSFLCKETADTKFVLKYADFYKPTSYDWMKKIVEAQFIGSEQIDGKTAVSLSVHLLDQPSDWKSVKFFIDDFYGLPIKIVIETDQGKTLTYNFDKHDVNSYSDSDLIPPQGY